MSAVRIKKSGFTLVEILIVVIILGILAAIVIPQFTDASQTAKANSLASQVQTIRSQVELYRSGHSSAGADKIFATLTSPATTWAELTNKTNYEGATGATADHSYGPYLQAVPVNNLNGLKTVALVTVSDEAAFEHSAAVGFLFDRASGKFWGTDKDGKKPYLPKQ